MTALTFKSQTFDVVDQNGQPWLTLADIAKALYAKGGDQTDASLDQGGDQSGPPSTNAIRQVQKLYQRHSDEFTAGMTSIVEMATRSGKQMMRIFSLRGAHLLAMFARTQVAKEFRAWVLDLLEHEYIKPFAKNPGDVLTIEQADLLRNAMTAHCARLPQKQQGPFMVKGWSKLKSHFKVSYRQIPQEQLTEAISIITRHAAEWEVVDDLPALPEASSKPVDVRGLMLSGHCTPTVKLPAGIAEELEQTAWRMAGEAFHLSKEYLQRRVAYLCEWNQPREVNAAKAMDVLKTSTLGFALTHHCYNEMAHVESFVRIAQEHINELMSEIGKFKN